MSRQALSETNLHQLRAMRDHFNRQAKEYANRAEALTEAITVLESRQNQIAQDRRSETAKSLAQGFTGKDGGTARHGFIFLVDGSGSMSFPPSTGSGLRHEASPIAQSLESIALIHKVGFIDKTPPVAAALFGDKQAHWQAAADLADAETLRKLKNGLNCGTDLAPSIEEAAAVLKEVGSRKKMHLVVISDGDLFDSQKAQPLLETLLSENKGATVDFVTYQRREGSTPHISTMEKLANDLAQKFPRQVKAHGVSLEKEDMLETIKSVMRDRTAAARKPQAKKSASPKR